MERPTETEHLKAMLKDSPKSEVEDGAGTSLDTGTSDGGLEDSKLLKASSQHRLLGHTLWVVVAVLLVILAANEYMLAPTAGSFPSFKGVHGYTSPPIVFLEILMTSRLFKSPTRLWQLWTL